MEHAMMRKIMMAAMFAFAFATPVPALFARDVKTNLPHRPSDGMKDVRTASSFGRDGKWKEGAEFVAKLRAIPAKGRNIEERQSVDMAEFALYRTNGKERERAIKALKAAYDAGPSTFWGWAAWHYLGEFGVSVPKPKQDPLRGLGKFGDGVVNMKVRFLEPAAGRKIMAGAAAKLLAKEAPLVPANPTVADFAEGSPARRAMLRTRLVEICTPAKIDEMLSMKGAEARFAKIWNDDRVLGDFLLSGPVFDGPAAIETLMTLYLNDEKERWSDSDTGRRATVAVAINSRRDDGGKVDMESTVRHWAAFRRIGEWDRFEAEAKKHDCREWRFVVRHPRDPGDTLYLNTRNFPKRYVHNTIFNVPYRKRNCFDVSKWAKNGEFMKPWTASGLPFQYLRTRVGGVCTEQSMWAALCANAHGLMAERAGQPGHCCWLLRRNKGDWRIYSNIRPYTAGVFLLWGKGFQYVVSTERAFADRKAHDESELLRFLADGGVARSGNGSRRSELIKMAAMRCPYNFPAWREYTDDMKKRGAKKEEWTAYLDTLLEKMPDGRLVTWDFVHEALDALAALGLDKNSLAKETARAFKALPQPKSWIAEEMNFRRDALGRELRRFGSRKDLKMKILVAALDANANSPIYLSHIFSCAFDQFARDEKAKKEFAALVAKFANGGDSAKIDWRNLYKRTKCLEDKAAYRMMASLRNEIDPAPAGGDAPPREDYGARLVSGDAYLTLSSSGKGNAIEDYPRVGDLSGVPKGRKFLVFTKDEPGQWAQLELRGDAILSGVTVSGDVGPAAVMLSMDGKEWMEVARIGGDGGRVDLGGTDRKAKFVRLVSLPEAGRRQMKIAKFLIYGKTLY